MVHERHWKGTLVWSNWGRRNLPNGRTCFPFNIHSDEDVKGMCSHSELYMGNNFLPSPLTWCFLVVTLNRPDEWEGCVYLVPFDESEFSLIYFSYYTDQHDYYCTDQWSSLVKNLPAARETRVWSLSQEDALEKGMATHPSVLAWRIPWTEEPCGL